MTLDLRFNLITDVSPLSGLTSLTTLNLSDNSVTDVNGLSSLTSLITIISLEQLDYECESIVGI